MKYLYLYTALLFSILTSPLRLAANPTFCCDAQNDLYSTLKKNGHSYARFDDALQAVKHAHEHSSVLILANDYPEKTTQVDTAALELATKKDITLYIEFPSELPGLEFGKVRGIVWERGIVTSDEFGSALPKGRILAVQDCHFVPVTNANPLLSIGRVAGFDTAVFGLPKESSPLLFELPERKLIVATTKLSHFATARYAPAQDWQTIWRYILHKIDPDVAVAKMEWKPVVRPAFSANEKLPRRVERTAFNAAADWIFQSRLLLTSSNYEYVAKTLAANKEGAVLPGPNDSKADGTLGILEGYSSAVRYDGSQRHCLPLRADCNAESAMVLSLNASMNHDRRSAKVAENLLDFVYFNSGICRGVRADPEHPAYGLIAWGDISPNWIKATYGDDEARVLQATMLAAHCLKSEKWNDLLMKGILANFRTTGKFGYRGDRIDIPDLEKNGWKFYRDAETVNYSPHFESYLWACYLWAYRETGYQPFLDKTKTAISMMMKAYPNGWRLGDNSERSRMLLCLSWLVRLEDTPEHRQWLTTVATDLLKRQQSTGSIHEWLKGTGGGHYQVPQSNEAYGQGETPLIQQNGDPASDQLYTTGFALFALHEAVAATSDAKLKQAEDKLAEFLCRIQIRSEKYPWLNGWWFRAFDDHRWEYWASSADAGWGAWCVEAGWAQAWTAATLGLRDMKVSFWDVTKDTGAAKSFGKFKDVMFEEPKKAAAF